MLLELEENYFINVNNISKVHITEYDDDEGVIFQWVFFMAGDDQVLRVKTIPSLHENAPIEKGEEILERTLHIKEMHFSPMFRTQELAKKWFKDNLQVLTLGKKENVH